MNITLRDTTTGTVLVPDPDTQLYINLTDAEAEAIAEEPLSTIATHPLQIFPPATADAADLYATFEDIKTYHDLIQATAGRALLLQLARMIQTRHAEETHQNLNDMYLEFQEDGTAGEPPLYRLTRLVGPENITIRDEDALATLVESVLGGTVMFHLGQLQVYTDQADQPIWRYPHQEPQTNIGWDPDTYRGLPQTLNVNLKDLLTVDQRI